jgi:integrase
MPRPQNSVPSYSNHKPTGQAYVRFPNGNGSRRVIYLGQYDSPESRTEYARIVQELAVSPIPNSFDRIVKDKSDVTMSELLNAYRKYAEQHYRHPDGTPTSEISVVKITLKAFREVYANKPISEFGPLCVKAIRQKWIDENHTRSECNRRVKIIKRILKWGLSEELVPATIYQAVASIAGLQRGRTKARELLPVLPVPDEVVDATLPYLSRHVCGLVEFQRLTGCRPGEACAIRRCDIDTGGMVWLYKPPHHKGSWQGKSRVIAIGPKAQELIKEFFTPNLDDYLFSPRRARGERIAEQAAKRQTPRYPSHMKRNAEKRKKNPQVSPAERYTKGSYAVAIDRACDVAFPPSGDLAQREEETYVAWWGQRIRGKWIEGRLTPTQKIEIKAWRKARRWSPNQLRHSHATKVRKEFGLEAAGAALGHSKMSATEIYAERDTQLAVTVASKIG